MPPEATDTPAELPTPDKVPPEWTTTGAVMTALLYRKPERSSTDDGPLRPMVSLEGAEASPRLRLSYVAPAAIFSREAKERLTVPAPGFDDRIAPLRSEATPKT